MTADDRAYRLLLRAYPVEAMRTQWSTDIQPMGAVMKAMAIFAILIGAIEAVNSSTEAWLGGIVKHGGYSLAGGVLGLVQSAAILCLVVFVSVRLLRPMFSVFATMLGIGFPIAMLIYVNRTRRGAIASQHAA